MDVQPRHLQYFLAVAEELHFGRAAARLYIAQPSLSLQIRNLEDALGTPLFVRSSRRVELTAAGRTLAKEAPGALAALDRVMQLTREAGAADRTTIRLGYTPVASFGVLTALLEAIRREHPEFTIDAHEFFSAEIPERIRAGDLDLGVALSPAITPGVFGALMRRERVSALLSSGHRLADAPNLTLHDLREETLLLFPRHLAPAYYDGIVAACRAAGFTPRLRAFDEPPVTAMLSRLASGVEVGLAPESFSERAAQVGTGVLRRSIASPSIPADFYLLQPAADARPGVVEVAGSARRFAERHGWLGGQEPR